MFFYFPFRAKNPPETFPWVTLSLIAINILIYVCTTSYLLEIREGVVNDWALAHNNFSVVRVFSAMFLHANIFHIFGNMWFLWLFGAGVEGRLGHLKYLLLYLAAGVAGNVLHDAAAGVLRPDMPVLGASGAVMGVMGACLYLFPFAQISILYVVGWGLRYRGGVVNWHSQWVILFFVVQDLFNAVITRSYGVSGGVANFAHLGGAALGFLVPMLARIKRDSEDFSEVQAMRADIGKNLMALSLPELQTLMDGAPDEVRVVMAFCRKAAAHYSGSGHGMCFTAIQNHKDLLFTEANPEQLAALLFGLPESCGTLPAAYEIRLATRLEQAGAYEMAIRMYRRVIAADPEGRDTEMALARLARLTEQTNPDKGHAAAIYAEQLRLFPHGPQAPYAENALRRLGPPTIVFSAGTGTIKIDTPLPAGLAFVQAGDKEGEAIPTVFAPPVEENGFLAEVGAPVQQPAYALHAASDDGYYAPPAAATMTLMPLGGNVAEAMPPSEDTPADAQKTP